MISLQPLTIGRFLVMIADVITNGAAFGYFAATVQEKKMSWKIWLYSSLYNISTICLINFLFNVDSSIRFPMSSILLLLFCFIVGKKRGFELFKSGFLMIGILLLSDSLVGIVLSQLPFLNADGFSYYDQFSNYIQAVSNAAVCLLMAAFTFLYKQMRKLHGKGYLKKTLSRYYRPVLIVLCTLFLLFRNLQRSEGMDFMARFMAFLPENITMSILLLIGFAYMIQDIRYISQLHRNDSLLQQQKIQDLLLKDTRVFRHNIANLLYGFQGMLLSKDYSAIQSYYDKMVSTCTIINNENVLALRRIPSMPLRALLVNKIQAANDMKIPFYVYVDENLNYRGIQDMKMCEVIGVLVDNAIDAAQESLAPFVSVEVHNAARDMEIVIRNTFREGQVMQASAFFPSLEPSKENHQGIGLIHAREIISKEKNVLLNIYYRGRFVEASALFS